MTEQNRGEGVFTPEQGASFTPSWVMEKADEYREYHPHIQLVARQLHQMPPLMLTPERLEDVYLKLQEKVINEEIPEIHAIPLMARIGTKHAELVETAMVSKEEKKSVEPEFRDTLTEAIKDLSFGVKDLRKLLEEAGQLKTALTEEQIEQLSTPEVVETSSQQTEALKKAFSRLSLQEEKHRWVDVEFDQEFYTRFAPNQEPYFYTKLSSSERKIWDARWRLARAAFYKKIYSAFPDKLAENQDLIELTTEQMEFLYKVKGVKESLKWYANLIVKRERVEIKGEMKSIYDCKQGADFELFREKLREGLSAEIFKNEPQVTEEEKMELETKLKSADAIAWNLIFCSNLVESADSRYGYSGERHGSLPPPLCSDDLRATFHPQEKYESKCAANPRPLEWGAFGKWGVAQMGKIRKESGFNSGSESFDFRAATREGEYWRWKRTNNYDEEGKRIIEVCAPECYPQETLVSFFEKYKYKDEKTGMEKPLIDWILEGDEINWKRVGPADLWKTSYLTVQMRKAVAIHELFMGKVKIQEGWTGPILDAFKRLGLDRRDDYHNLKVWGYYATEGGVKHPERAKITSPIGPIDRWSREGRLRQAKFGYLDQGENLLVKPNLLVKVKV